MEVVLDMKGLDRPCRCGSAKAGVKLAGNCCRKEESCPCGSGEKVSKCCIGRMEKKNGL